MSVVTSLTDWKEKQSPHSFGKARCLACKHEWVAVAPVGAIWLDCPECTLERGRFIAQHEREGEHWHCLCGNNLFQATRNGMYCPNCAEWQKGFDELQRNL